MGYIIEISFDIVKNGSSSIKNIVTNANDNFCDDIFEDFEFENKTQFQRRHCVIYVKFSNERINNMVEFLNSLKTQRVYVETIYDENKDSLLYASQYYITQKMDKTVAKEFKTNRSKRSYSEGEKMILNTVLN